MSSVAIFVWHFKGRDDRYIMCPAIFGRGTTFVTATRDKAFPNRSTLKETSLLPWEQILVRVDSY